MLPRAASRAIPPSSAPSRHLRHPSPALSIAARLQRRPYAQSAKPRRATPPPLPPAARPSPTPGAKQAPRPTPPPPPPQRPHIHTPTLRQTSPGTTLPKDRTWKPTDTIKFATTASSAEAADLRHGQRDAPPQPSTSTDGTRPEAAAARHSSPLEGDAGAQEPLAQKADLDEPLPHTQWGQAHAAQAGSENTTPPPEAPPPPPPPPEEELPPQQHQQRRQDFRLPDLRQGIPSTFDLEFGSGKPKQGTAASQQNSTDGAQNPGFDLTEAAAAAADSPASGNPSSSSREERSYSQKDYETSLDRRRAQYANYAFLAFLASLAGAALYLARPFPATEGVPSGLPPRDTEGWSPGKLYLRAKARLGSQMGYYTEPTFPQLLPTVPEAQRQPFTLVLSLEDLMIHTSWDRTNGYRTAKRPGLDYFIRYLSQYYELVLFTSTPLAIADPVIKKLDPFHFIMWPLGREATKYDKGEYVKDLQYLNRPLSKTIIIDTHAAHVKNQPDNAVILPKWSGDPKDPHAKDLVALIPFLEYLATMGTEDVRPVLRSFGGKPIPEEFARREAEARRSFNAQLAEQRSRAPKHSLGSVVNSSLGLKGSAAVAGPGAGGLVLADGQSVAQGLAQGKMLSDQIREQGQRQYEHLERQIREHGAQWLREEEEEQKRLLEVQMREMKGSAFGWFGARKE